MRKDLANLGIKEVAMDVRAYTIFEKMTFDDSFCKLAENIKEDIRKYMEDWDNMDAQPFIVPEIRK